MAKVKRANVVLRIKDDAVARYLDMGYSQIDEVTGEVINSPIPSDTATLRTYYVEHITKIKELEAEIAELKKASAKKSVVKAEDKPSKAKSDV